jgi:outer membrane protein assembly factor BamD
VTLGKFDRACRVLLVGIFAAMLATGCRSHRGDDEAKSGPDTLYKRAHDSLNNQSFEEAIRVLEALQSRFPFSDPARQARLDLIYAYYKTHATEQAIDAADTFIRENPASPRVDYALYMKGLVYFERQPNFIERYFNVDLSERAPVDSVKSFDAFTTLIKRYPRSEYVNDARQRMIYLRNRLAGYELRVAQYYMRRGAYVGAMNRAKYAVENYDGAPAIQPALAVLIQSYRALKMDDLAANAERVYKENYPEDTKNIARKRHWWSFF